MHLTYADMQIHESNTHTVVSRKSNLPLYDWPQAAGCIYHSACCDVTCRPILRSARCGRLHSTAFTQLQRGRGSRAERSRSREQAQTTGGDRLQPSLTAPSIFNAVGRGRGVSRRRPRRCWTCLVRLRLSSWSSLTLVLVNTSWWKHTCTPVFPNTSKNTKNQTNVLLSPLLGRTGGCRMRFV